VDTLINFRVPYDAGISWLVEGLLTSKEGLLFMELVCLLVGWLFGWLQAYIIIRSFDWLVG
jgi:cell division protein FtsX